MTAKTEVVQERALAKVEKSIAAEPIKSVQALTEKWQELSREANLISPISAIDSIPAMHGVSLRVVTIDPTVDRFGNGAEVYKDSRFCQDNELALGGVALQKIAAAAGVKFERRVRLDDRSEPYYCEIEVTLSIRDYDGTKRVVTKAREVDLRDDAPEAMKPEKLKKEGDRYPTKTGRMIPLDPSALADKRRHIQSLAETKAFHRALRTILQLKQKYTLDELRKPFVVPKLVPYLDPSDPDQKRALIDMAMGRESDLYGEPTETRELKDVTPPALVDSSQPLGAPEDVTATDEEKKSDPGDFNPDELEPLEIPPDEPAAVCACPCGDQHELTEVVAKMTAERCGAPRCADCYPSPRFDVERHRELGDLKLPKFPGLTAERIEAGRKKGGAK